MCGVLRRLRWCCGTRFAAPLLLLLGCAATAAWGGGRRVQLSMLGCGACAATMERRLLDALRLAEPRAPEAPPQAPPAAHGLSGGRPQPDAGHRSESCFAGQARMCVCVCVCDLLSGLVCLGSDWESFRVAASFVKGDGHEVGGRCVDFRGPGSVGDATVAVQPCRHAVGFCLRQVAMRKQGKERGLLLQQQLLPALQPAARQPAA
jgi:hypothetical protein